MPTKKPFHVELLLQEINKRKQSNPRYSLRAFARFLGIGSSTLSRVLTDSQEISISACRKIIKKLKFSENERLMFIASVADEKKHRTFKLLSKPMDSNVEENFSMMVEDKLAAEARMQFLTSAGRILAASMDFHSALEGVANLAIQSLSDGCVIHIKTENDVTLFHVKHISEEQKILLMKMVEKFPFKDCLAIPEFSGKMIEKLSHSEEHHKLLKMLDLGSFVCVPMMANSKIFGTISLIRSKERKPFSKKDMDLAHELGFRAGHAIDYNLFNKKT